MDYKARRLTGFFACLLWDAHQPGQEDCGSRNTERIPWAGPVRVPKAGAEDASTSLYNPASTSRRTQSQFMATGGLMHRSSMSMSIAARC